MKYIPKFQSPSGFIVRTGEMLPQSVLVKKAKKTPNPQLSAKPDPNAGNLAADIGTRILSATKTFGGSVIGNVVKDVGGQKAADAVEKYTLGMIPYTRDEEFKGNRKSWNSRAQNSVDAANSYMIGKTFGAITELPYLKPGFNQLKQWGNAALNTIKSKKASYPINSAIEISFDHSKPIPTSVLRTGDDLLTTAKQSKQNILDYIQHPIVQETAAKNTELSKRIKLGLPIMLDAEGKNAATDITSYRLANLRKPTVVNFAELPENVYGTHQFGMPNSKIKVNWAEYAQKNPTSELSLNNTLEHEFGHHARIGNSKIEDLKAEKLLWPYGKLMGAESDSQMMRSGSDNVPYLTIPGEASMNVRDLGIDLGLTVGQKYPGMEVLQNILNNYNGNKSFVVNDLRLGVARDYKRVWDAMTGKYFTVPATALTGKTLLDK